jgi:hypothetical protein
MTLVRTGAVLLCCLFVIALVISALGIVKSRFMGK